MDKGTGSETQNINTAEISSGIGANEDLDKTNVSIEIPNTKISYYPLRNIGHGATSSVYLGLFGNTDCKTSAAVKLVKQEYSKTLQNELQIWKLLLNDSSGSSSNIVKLFDWGQYETNNSNLAKTETMFVLAMEPASCNLRQFVVTMNPPPSLFVLKSVCLDVAKGLKFLHGNQILHRDIKPENVLIFGSNENIDAKLGDFGLSSVINLGTTNSTARGTELWMSPEALTKLHQGKKFKNTKSVDIFSLGMTMYFALSKGQHPFSYSEQHGNFPEMNIKDPTIVPNKLLFEPNFTEMDLLEWMMQKDPQKRPKIQQVLLHPMFWGKEKCLDFICFIARKNNDKKDSKCKERRLEIEKEYKEFHKSLFSGELKWMSLVDQRLFERKGSGKKRYEENIFSLVELIRDKREHHCDMVEELLERFSENGTFSDEKYIEYFLGLFPQIIKFFFSYFIKRRDSFNHNEIKSTSFETENKVFTSAEMEEAEDGNLEEISDLDSGKLQVDPKKELKSIAVQTMDSTNETEGQINKDEDKNKEVRDINRWNENDYNGWDELEYDHDLQDGYDPAEDYYEEDYYNPAEDYYPEDDYDPAEDYGLQDVYDDCY